MRVDDLRPLRALRRAERRAAGRAARRRRGGRFDAGRRPLPRGRARGLLVGAASTARSTWCATSAARTSWSAHGRARVGGPAASGRGTTHGVYLATGRGAAPGRMLRVPADGARASCAQAWSRSAVHLIAGLFQHGAQHRGRRAPARGAGHARHAGGRARARDQQPGVGGDPRGRRAAGRLRGRSCRRSAGWPCGDHRRAVRRARRAAAARSSRRPRRRTRSASPTARRRSPTGSTRHGVEQRLAHRPPLAAAGRRRGVVRAGGRGARRRRARARPASGWRARSRARRCSPR